MTERVSIDQLIVGMYLVGIDKSWMDTPFLRHHFKISSEAQIAKLKAIGVRVVEIDPERGSPSNAGDGGPNVPRKDPKPEPSKGQDLPAEPLTASQPGTIPNKTTSYDVGESGDASVTRIHRTDNAEGSIEFTSLLRVRMFMQLAFPSQRQHSLYTTRLLGWSDRNFLLTELPFAEGRAIEFRPGISCIVRFVESGRVFGFKTETIRGQFSPIPLLFLAFPQEIEELCLRRSPRVPVSLKAQVRLTSVAHAVEGIVRDLSLSGCRVELTSPQLTPLQGSPVALDLNLPGVGPLTGLQGLIRNVSIKSARTEAQPKMLLGIEFEFQHTDPGAPAAVERYVNDQVMLSQA